MISRIASLGVAAAAVLGMASSPASAAVNPPCLAAVNRPCAWHQPVGGGIAGSARLDAPSEDQLSLLRVEVRVERSWGSPWETVASAIRVQSGSIEMTTPAITTDYLTMVCATGGPADDPTLQDTFCTAPR